MSAGNRSIISKRTDPAFHPLTIAAVEPLTRDAVTVTFAVPAPLRERFTFQPGQFLTLEAEIDGEPVRRSYSICSTPDAPGLRVAIKRVADGRFSTWAHAALVPGAMVAVAPPAGRFGTALRAATRSDGHTLAFAAGSGITPILAIVAHALETEPERRVTLVYGNRAASHVMFREEILALKNRYLDRFAPLFVMSREPQDIDALAGRIDEATCDALLRGWIDARDVDRAYVCGPRDMHAGVVAALVAHGIAREHIAIERFGVTSSGAADDVRTSQPRNGDAMVPDVGWCDARATVDGRAFEFSIRREETVLDAALRAGVELPYSCKGGVCSTCRAVLVDGEVDMDVHYALEDYEIARGFILTCQSYAATRALHIDLDARELG